ncbi:PucR family transcriptional regulator [Nocardia terpenica]|uniref:PucR C-terminal helix-turn-helix domain-containing protein n=1 Tax=Nocardia terpenica TaxID=455432 RepID=A0A6G9ZCN8_9NOCA|nr:helix-turn-helix domain-containing protein [Nocardia terpenica]QIS23375.1 hypothetical protein F6W96_38630 [Nocardia terpenica]
MAETSSLASALLAGRPVSAIARESGIAIADEYHVVALAIPPHHDHHGPAADVAAEARHRAHRLQAALAERGGTAVLSQLSVGGGTVLIPRPRVGDRDIDLLIQHAARSAQIPVTATVVSSTAAGILAAAQRAHELLDVAQRLRVRHGVYRFDDLALEYQLTRPGPGREYLASLLDPLDGHPELRNTLVQHIGSGLYRQQTARILNVHVNTVDYRLRRIAQLTGLDPGQPAGLWYLQSALVAYAFSSAHRPDRQGEIC